jgi:uncharacterized protein DUF2764
MANYYFLITALPPVSIGKKPEITFKGLMEMLALNLTPKDLQLVGLLLQPIDLYNMRALWLGFPLDDRGNYKAKELEEALLVKDMLPPYVIDYLERYESTNDRLRYFSSLYVSLFRDEQTHLKGFLKKYYQLEREIRLVLTALRSKKTGRDLVRELQFEDPYEPFVSDILAQKDAADYIPPKEYEDLKTLFMENSSSPQKLNRAILQYRFEKIEEMEENQDFTIDRVLCYIARLLIVESLEQLDLEKETGTIALEQLSQYG